MAYIQKIKTKKGTAHRVQYSKQNRPYSKYFSAAVPYAYVKNWAAQTEAAKLPHLQAVRITVKDLFTEYQTRRETEIDLTWHKSSMQAFLNLVDPSTPAATITWQIIHNFRDQRLKFKQSAATDYTAIQRARRGVNKELSNLRTIFNWAYQKDILPNKIFDKVEFLKASEPIPSTLTRDAEKQFLKNLEKPYKLAYWILKYTGLRRGECIRLTWQDIDLKEKRIFINKTKNGQQAIIPILKGLERILKWLTRKPKQGNLFSYHKDTLTSAFRRALDRAGLQNIENPVHVFRHTGGLRIMEKDVSDSNQRLAQEFLRHSGPQMTRRYTRILLENQRQKMNTIDL